jgi:integrase
MSAGLDSRLGSMGGVMRRVSGFWSVSRYRPVSRSALRPSEMRGLRWIDIDFEGRQINVNKRSDASHRIGKLKSEAAYRSIPSPPIVLNVLSSGSWSVRRAISG